MASPAPDQLVPYAALLEGLPNMVEMARQRRVPPHEQWIRAYQQLSPERQERVKLQVRPDGTVLVRLIQQLLEEQKRVHPPENPTLYSPSRKAHHFGVRGALEDTTKSTV